MSSNFSLEPKQATRKRKGQSNDENPKPSKSHVMKTRSQSSSSSAKAIVMEPNRKTVTKFTPEQQVLNIPHLAEKILHASALSDVYNMRLVSQHMNSNAIRAIQKRKTLCFDNFWLEPRQIGKTLATFTRLVRQPQYRYCPIPFRKFIFTTCTTNGSGRQGTLNHPALQKFLRVHGTNIVELSLQVTTGFKSKDLTENEVISHVKHLLTMVPNVQELFLSHDCTVEWVTPGKNVYSPLSLTDPECIELHSEKDIICNEKLKFLALQSVSAKLCEMILIRAPNLRVAEMLVPQSENYLLEPFRRVHLQQSMYRRALPWFFETYENINRRLKIVGGVNVRTVHITVDMWLSINFQDDDDMNRFVEIINDLLVLVGETVEEFGWDGVGPLDSLKWPDVLPSVKTLSLINPCSMEDLLENSDCYASQEFKILSKLPKLRVVSFSEFREDDFILLANSFGESEFPGVQEVSYVCAESVISVREDNQEGIQRLFPNATTRLTPFD